jgi:hypothetical protein
MIKAVVNVPAPRQQVFRVLSNYVRYKESVTFKMTKSEDLKAYSGTYRLMDSTDGVGTVVIAELEIDIGMMVPKFIVDKMTRKMMDDTGVALCKYIQAAPRAPLPSLTSTAGKRRRARRVLRITKTAAGYHVWLLGETFVVKNRNPLAAISRKTGVEARVQTMPQGQPRNRSVP